MGFLRRLGGGAKAEPTTRAEFNATWFTDIREDACLQVVGEAYVPDFVAKARRPGMTDLPPGRPTPPAGYYKAMLVPQPTNPHDRNAIVVVIWAGGSWAQSGYLAREDAARYQPLFRYLARDGGSPAIVCDAALVDERGGIGVVLHLGTPGECMISLITGDRQPAVHPWCGWVVVFTGQSETLVCGVPLDREAQGMVARWAGCAVLPRVTKKAQALITANPRELTGNTQKARDYGIPIIAEVDFLSTVGLPPETVSRDDQRWARR